MKKIPIYHVHGGEIQCGELAAYFYKKHPDYTDEVELPDGSHQPPGLFCCPVCDSALSHEWGDDDEHGGPYATFSVLRERV